MNPPEGPAGPPGLAVAPLGSDDLAAAARIAAAGGLPSWGEDELARTLAAEVGVGWRARLDRATVGFALAQVVAGEAELLVLAVDPAHRRRGIGAALLAAVLRSSPVVHLEVREDNLAARALYERGGLRAVGRRERYYADGAAAVLMRGTAPS